MDTMQEEGYQRELFEFEKPKRSFPKLSMTPRGDFAVILTLDKLVFVAIGIIMLMVVVYALGIERGKSAGYRKVPVVQGNIGEKSRTTHAKTVSQDVPGAAGAVNAAGPQNLQAQSLQPTDASVSGPTSSKTGVTIRPKAAASQAAASLPGLSGEQITEAVKPYVIVAAALTKKENAQREAGNLMTAGFESFVSQSDKYYIVCVGAYQSKESAKADLNKVRKFYKDAYLKMR